MCAPLAGFKSRCTTPALHTQLCTVSYASLHRHNTSVACVARTIKRPDAVRRVEPARVLRQWLHDHSRVLQCFSHKQTPSEFASPLVRVLRVDCIVACARHLVPAFDNGNRVVGRVELQVICGQRLSLADSHSARDAVIIPMRLPVSRSAFRLAWDDSCSRPQSFPNRRRATSCRKPS